MNNSFPEILTAESTKGFVDIGRGSTHPHHGWMDGRHYVLKCGSYSELSSDGHVHNECVADAILRTAGCAVPHSREYRADIGNGRIETLRLSAFIEHGMTLADALHVASADQRHRLVEQVVEAYPVIAFIDGTDTYQHRILDNVLVDRDFTMWFIDNGASFDYRARGLKKGWFWERGDVRDAEHGFFSVWDRINGTLRSYVGSVLRDDLIRAIAKFDFMALVGALPDDYRRPALFSFARGMKALCDKILNEE